MSDTTIFDIGFHKCEDVTYYLTRGCRVIAVDADLRNIESARTRFSAQIASGQLTLVHAAISDTDDQLIKFHLSKNTVWSSLNPEIANRRNE
ncbi:MAG: hypothetical protein KF861_06380, partial [Planctomycetaceae bacterium]|nr:hypothetical protein [Planctomycetaceae bacterium]